MSSVNPVEYLGEHKEFLQRFNLEQQEIIYRYWDQIRWTRTTGRIAENLIKAEIEYWNNFEADEVIKALEIHLNTTAYKKLRENYTRGILRNIKVVAPSSADAVHNHKAKNKFHNHIQREYDPAEYEEAGKKTVEKYFNNNGGFDEAEARAKKFLEERNKTLESERI